MSDLVQKLLIGVALAFAGTAGSISLAMVRSDSPPWIGKTQAESLFLEIDIKESLRDYCEAERMHNIAAARGANDDITAYETRYATINDGRQIPLRPCP